MLLTEYLDSIENTEQEQKFLQQLAELKPHFQPAAKVPFVGKTICALIALPDIGSIDEFRQSEHYAAIDGYNITTIGDAFSITPGKDQMIKAAIFVGCVVLTIIILKRLFRK